MAWKEKISEGLALIIEGCRDNSSWTKCKECPFTVFCTAVYKDVEIPYSTPDCYIEEGYNFDLEV